RALIRKKGCLQLGLRGIPPIEQKTLDGWGTPMFHPSRVEDAGGGLIQNRVPASFSSTCSVVISILPEELQGPGPKGRVISPLFRGLKSPAPSAISDLQL
ncbi:MAG: hypothetical protein WAL75_14170, partial [Terracidiphilus sp.]